MAVATAGAPAPVMACTVTLTLALAVNLTVTLPGPPAGATGATFTPTEAAVPANASTDPSGALSQVSCASTSSCVAVGTYLAGAQEGLIEAIGSGGSSATEAPVPSGAVSGAVLTGVSCLPGDPCVAVGNYTDTNGFPLGVIETDASGTWSATKAPVPVNAYVDPYLFLDAVTCSSPVSCVAVGQYEVGTTSEGLIETLSGGTWKATEAPVPAGAPTHPYASLSAVSCPDTVTCVAVGGYSTTTPQGLVETSTNGAAWSASSLVADQITLTGVSCPDGSTDPGGTVCTAVGSAVNASGSTEGLIESLSAGTWNALSAPEPADESTSSPDLSLAGVSCRAVGSCAAVGQTQVSAGSGGVVESLASGSWSAADAPLPANAKTTLLDAHLAGVSCPVSDGCAAVGAYRDTAGHGDGLIEVSAGSTTPRPRLTSISPAVGPTSGDTKVSITGHHFEGALAVDFGSVPAKRFSVHSDSTITAVSPPGTGKQPITVTTAAGTSPATSADVFRYKT